MIVINPRIVLASVISLLVLSACNSDQQTKSSTPAAKEAVEATVNGIAISKSRVDLIAKQSADAGQPDSPDVRKSIIDQLIIQTLVVDEAIKKGLDKSQEVREQIDLMRQSALADAYVQDFIKANSVSDEMLKTEYERIKGTIGNEYRARHILVKTDAEARDIIAKLQKDPASFAKLAQEKSSDTASKAKGGDLGWFDPRRMAPEFGAAVKALEKGKISEEPVVTSFGFHVILLEDSRPIEPPPLEGIKTGLTQQIQQQNLMKHLDDLKSKAKIEMSKGPEAETKKPETDQAPVVPAK
jgi:peptidyl-prolyl cis-trans isomerase C